MHQDDRTGGAPSARPGLFERLGRFCARHPRAIVAVWALAAIVALPLAPRAAETLRPGGFSLESLDSERTIHLLEAEIGLPPSALVIVIQGENGLRAGDVAFEEAAARAIADVPAAQHVAEVLSHRLSPRQVSADGSTVYEVVALDLAPDDSPDAVVPIQNALHQQPGLRIGIAGGPAFYGDIQAVSEHDLRRSELISLPLAAFALLVVFGSVVAAGVPVIVGGVSVIVALAAIFVAASLTPMSIFVLNLATLLGFGLGVDYALLLSSRFREELRALRAATGGTDGEPKRGDRELVETAIATTVATAGRAVFFSGLTVMLGLIGLMLFEFMVLRSVGIAGAIVLSLAVAGALTLQPALLSLVGTRLDALPISGLIPRRFRRRRRPAMTAPTAPGAARPDGTAPTTGGFWWRLANRVMDHPVAVFVPTLCLLLLLGLPFLHARFNAPDASILPPNVPSKISFDALASHFEEGEFAPLLLAVRSEGPITGPDNVSRLYEYSRRLAADARVARVQSIVDIDPRLGLTQYQLLLGNSAGPGDRSIAEILARSTRGDLTAFTVIAHYGPNAPQARALVKDLRDPGSNLSPPAGLSVAVGGGAAEVADVVDRMAADFPRSAAFIIVSTYLVLFVLLRSVVLPAKALVMNALSIVASFGALVWIFQDGNLSALLGFTPLGFVETTQPVILFCVLFGLSMDYEVFLLTRMKEAWDRTGNNREAVARGLERSGRIVTSAALIVVLVASSFSAAEVVLIKALGLGVAIAVALDATVVRALLVPSTMRLLGKWNWWMPERLNRWVSSRLPVVSGTLALAIAAAITLAACTPGAAILANPAPTSRPLPTATAFPSRAPDPQPVSLPRDDGPHDRLTEWWYDTGHLQSADGRHFGFEMVIFRAERGDLPVSWASHLAITDESGGRFLYDQRSEVGGQVDRPTPGSGFDLAIRGDTVPGLPNAAAEPWTMRGAGGRDRLLGAGSAGGAAFGIDLSLDAGTRPPALHDHDGYVDFGPAGGSYYYSRTRMAATGTLTLDGTPLQVTGEAWFDHQWGDFIAVGGGGWDWFAVNLDDGTDVTLSLVRSADGTYPLVYGTRVTPEGTAHHLDRDAFSVAVTAQWTSPRTGAVYPAGWRITFKDDDLVIELRPTVADQELDTRPSTGVVYWEGSQVVSATRDGRQVGGQAYVELTGYGPGV
ncbi:MAG: putative drug exporter of the superfamily [Chloroflexota bacterium]|nr:putative drug exporter of the superfamily [Chloroflexota bacterium]